MVWLLLLTREGEGETTTSRWSASAVRPRIVTKCEVRCIPHYRYSRTRTWGWTECFDDLMQEHDGANADQSLWLGVYQVERRVMACGPS